MDDYTTRINNNVNSLFRSMEQRVSVDDMRRIRAAYELAAEAHGAQFRKTGEPYIIHPIAVARIVAEELELGANPVIAAFLHDVVEDTDYTIDDIRERFGDDVAFLVGVVTKQKKERYEQSKQVDNFRQILASVQYDVRAILIKLADRLHNMRTLDSMRPDKQMKIAGETDYFYAPLANRLGLYHVKTELENLSFRYRCPKEYAAIERQLAEWQNAGKAEIGAFVRKIADTLASDAIDADIEVRYRKPYSIWRKMQSSGCDFRHISNKLLYLRIVYRCPQPDEKRMSLRIYSLLTDCFKERPGGVMNYIDTPKENGYQSFHFKLLSEHGAWVELHISSERMVRASRLGCAAERTEANVAQWLEKFKGVLQDVALHSGDMDYMDGVTASFYNDDIMVFTPQGRGIILPKGATALDFAFEIHSDVGKHAEYARINGRLQSVKTVLQRGDCVEIGTNEYVYPTPDWQSCVLTYKAKRQLRTYFAHQEQLVCKRCLHCHPLPGDEVVGFRSDDGTVEIHRRDCRTVIRLASQYGDSIVAAEFKENEHVLYPVRIHIRGVDRYHLLSDLIDCITEQQHLSMTRLTTETADRIATCTVDFMIHSVSELQQTIDSILLIKGIDEVQRVNIE